MSDTKVAPGDLGNDLGNAPNQARHKKKGLSRANTTKVIAKVQDPNIDTEKLLTNTKCYDKKTDDWVKLKLKLWDKDQNQSFSKEEVDAAMEELKEAEEDLADLKWIFIKLFSFLIVFLIFISGAGAIAFAMTKETTVEGEGLSAPNPTSKKPGMTELVTTTEAHGNFSLLNLLDFDNTTDQWLFDEAKLRELDKVSFSDENQTYYNLDVAELIRIDSGPTGGANDKLEILTTSGTRLRVWESVGELEVLYPEEPMWSTATAAPNPAPAAAPAGNISGGRRMHGRMHVVHDVVDDEPPLHFTEEQEREMEDEWENSHDPRAPRRLGKGGYVFVSAHHRSHGGGHGCQNYCSVPHGTKESCRKWCGYNYCYTWGSSTYKCQGGAVRTFLGSSLLPLLAAIFLTQTS